jgi:hypothetical protein
MAMPILSSGSKIIAIMPLHKKEARKKTVDLPSPLSQVHCLVRGFT